MNEEKLKSIAEKAYVYFYPLVSMEVTRLQFMYSPVSEDTPAGGPLNVIGHFRSYPSATMKTVVRPNFDTLYSSGFLDVTEEPVVMTIGTNPDQRYFELPLYDMWTDAFAVPGSRTNGYDAKDFLIVPTDWSGEVPEGLEVIVAPTKYIWLIGRIQANGANDQTIHPYQDTLKLIPLSNWLSKEPFTPKQPPKRDDVDIKTPPTLLVNALSAEEYYNLAMEALEHSPPHYTDWSIFNQISQIGIRPGGKFEELEESVKAALQEQLKPALQSIYGAAQKVGVQLNGWQILNEVMGVYGNEYMKRAVITLVGLGANPVEEAIYPLSIGDQDEQPLLAENQYIIHFEKGNFPPVGAFWSYTLYDVDGYQVANEINRFAIGDRDDLYFEEDGSLTIYIQKDKPAGELAKNWLPTPQSGEFNITLRLYEPKKEVAALDWLPPVIQKVN